MVRCQSTRRRDPCAIATAAAADRRAHGGFELGGINSGQLRYQFFEPVSDIAVVMRTDIACLRYKARIDITVRDGHDTGDFWHIEIYRNNGDCWQQSGRKRHDSATDRSHRAPETPCSRT